MKTDDNKQFNELASIMTKGYLRLCETREWQRKRAKGVTGRCKNSPKKDSRKRKKPLDVSALSKHS